jgi:polysaccharide pyruvyl transferase WcaK-like protein
MSANLGDRAIYDALQHILRSHGFAEVHSFPIKTLYLQNRRRSFPFEWFLRTLRALAIGIPAHYARLAVRIGKVDLVVVGGGNLILDHSILSPVQFLTTCLLSKALGKRLFVCAIGAGPVRYDLSKRLYRRALQLADKITVRDAYSAQVITSAEAIGLDRSMMLLSADPAFATPRQAWRTCGSKPIGMSTFAHMHRDYAGGAADRHARYVNAMARLIDRVVDVTGRYVRLIPTEAPYDVETMEDIFAKARSQERMERTYPRSVPELLKYVGECEVLVGTRMHSMILALTQNVPIIGLAWHRKIDCLFEELGLQGLNFNIDEFSVEQVVCATEVVIAQAAEYKTIIEGQMERLQQSARANGILAAALLSHEAGDR